jgi:hypothetical protein
MDYSGAASAKSLSVPLLSVAIIQEHTPSDLRSLAEFCNGISSACHHLQQSETKEAERLNEEVGVEIEEIILNESIWAVCFNLYGTKTRKRYAEISLDWRGKVIEDKAKELQSSIAGALSIALNGAPKFTSNEKPLFS